MSPITPCVPGDPPGAASRGSNRCFQAGPQAGTRPAGAPGKSESGRSSTQPDRGGVRGSPGAAAPLSARSSRFAGTFPTGTGAAGQPVRSVGRGKGSGGKGRGEGSGDGAPGPADGPSGSARGSRLRAPVPSTASALPLPRAVGSGLDVAGMNKGAAGGARRGRAADRQGAAPAARRGR